jgi:hypothetical protein
MNRERLLLLLDKNHQHSCCSNIVEAICALPVSDPVRLSKVIRKGLYAFDQHKINLQSGQCNILDATWNNAMCVLNVEAFKSVLHITLNTLLSELRKIEEHRRYWRKEMIPSTYSYLLSTISKESVYREARDKHASITLLERKLVKHAGLLHRQIYKISLIDACRYPDAYFQLADEIDSCCQSLSFVYADNAETSENDSEYIHPFTTFLQTASGLMHSLRNAMNIFGASENDTAHANLSDGYLQPSHQTLARNFSSTLELLQVRDTRSMLETVHHLTQLSSTLNSWISMTLQPLERPSHIRRYWMTYVAVFAGTGMLSYQISKKQELISSLFQSLNNMGHNFYRDHIAEPAQNIYTNVMKTRHYSRPDVPTHDTLSRERNELSKMLLEFGMQHAKEECKTSNISLEEYKQNLEERAQKGDMSIVMNKYTADLQSPISNMMTGSLIRGMLIQIQKMKLEGEEMLMDMDQLMGQNEINFNIFATMPAIIVISGLVYGLKNVTSRMSGKYEWTWYIFRGLREGLRKVEMILVANCHAGAFDFAPYTDYNGVRAVDRIGGDEGGAAGSMHSSVSGTNKRGRHLHFALPPKFAAEPAIKQGKNGLDKWKDSKDTKTNHSVEPGVSGVAPDAPAHHARPSTGGMTVSFAPSPCLSPSPVPASALSLINQEAPPQTQSQLNGHSATLSIMVQTLEAAAAKPHCDSLSKLPSILAEDSHDDSKHSRYLSRYAFDV